MSRNKKQPTLPPLFFSSLSIDQQKQLLIILGEQEAYYRQYYKFRLGLFKTSAFIYLVWDKRLFDQIIKPSKLNKSMWLLLVLIYGIKLSPKHKNKTLTRQLIMDEAVCVGNIYRFRQRIFIHVRFLEKFGYLSSTRLTVTRRKQFFITEKAQLLINTYSNEYSKLFNDFFMPLDDL